MKNSCLFLMLLFIISSCTEGSESSCLEDSHIESTDVLATSLDFFEPIDAANSLVYKNATGEQMTFLITTGSSLEDSLSTFKFLCEGDIVDGTYTYERKWLAGIDENNNILSINIHNEYQDNTEEEGISQADYVGGNYNLDYKVQDRLWMSVSENSIQSYRTSGAEISFLEAITINDKSFNQVILNNLDFESSSLIMNRTVGIVAYKDELDNWWTFDRFE